MNCEAWQIKGILCIMWFHSLDNNDIRPNSITLQIHKFDSTVESYSLYLKGILIILSGSLMQLNDVEYQKTKRCLLSTIWHSGNVVCRTNKVTLHRAPLVVGWVTNRHSLPVQYRLYWTGKLRRYIYQYPGQFSILPAKVRWCSLRLVSEGRVAQMQVAHCTSKTMSPVSRCHTERFCLVVSQTWYKALYKCLVSSTLLNCILF